MLFLIALQMIFGPAKPDSEVAEGKQHPGDVAIFLLAAPFVASQRRSVTAFSGTGGG